MTERCDLCREPAETVKGTMMKRGSGGHIEVCDDCRERLEAARCRVCGALIERDDPAFVYFTGEGPTLEVCSDCRDDILFGNGVSFDG